jgi:hypothetical protein
MFIAEATPTGNLKALNGYIKWAILGPFSVSRLTFRNDIRWVAGGPGQPAPEFTFKNPGMFSNQKSEIENQKCLVTLTRAPHH